MIGTGVVILFAIILAAITAVMAPPGLGSIIMPILALWAVYTLVYGAMSA